MAKELTAEIYRDMGLKWPLRYTVKYIVDGRRHHFNDYAITRRGARRMVRRTRKASTTPRLVETL